MTRKQIKRAKRDLEDVGSPANRKEFSLELRDQLDHDLDASRQRRVGLVAEHRDAYANWSGKDAAADALPYAIVDDMTISRAYRVAAFVALIAEMGLAAWMFAKRGLHPAAGAFFALGITLIFERAIHFVVVGPLGQRRPWRSLRVLKRVAFYPALVCFTIAVVITIFARTIEGPLAAETGVIVMVTSSLFALTLGLVFLAATLFTAAFIYGWSERLAAQYWGLDADERATRTFLSQIRRHLGEEPLAVAPAIVVDVPRTGGVPAAAGAAAEAPLAASAPAAAARPSLVPARPVDDTATASGSDESRKTATPSGDDDQATTLASTRPAAAPLSRVGGGVGALLIAAIAISGVACTAPDAGALSAASRMSGAVVTAPTVRCHVVLDRSGSVADLPLVWNQVRTQLTALVRDTPCDQLQVWEFDVDGWNWRPMLQDPIGLPPRTVVETRALPAELEDATNFKEAAAKLLEQQQADADKAWDAQVGPRLAEPLRTVTNRLAAPHSTSSSDPVGALRRVSETRTRTREVYVIVTDMADTAFGDAPPRVKAPHSNVHLIVLLAPANASDARRTDSPAYAPDQFQRRSEMLRRIAPWVVVAPYFTDGLAGLVGAPAPAATVQR